MYWHKEPFRLDLAPIFGRACFPDSSLSWIFLYRSSWRQFWVWIKTSSPTMTTETSSPTNCQRWDQINVGPLFYSLTFLDCVFSRGKQRKRARGEFHFLLPPARWAKENNQGGNIGGVEWAPRSKGLFLSREHAPNKKAYMRRSICLANWSKKYKQIRVVAQSGTPTWWG